MGYKKASFILPYDLLRAVQEYIDGECIYIPRKNGKEKSWGENTRIRERLLARNREIAARRKAGCPVSVLAEQYFLSAKTIYKILNATEND